MVNLAHLGVSKEEGTMPETLIGKFSILAVPYGSVDGVNEKGLSVSVLELQTEPTNQETGKQLLSLPLLYECYWIKQLLLKKRLLY